MKIGFYKLGLNNQKVNTLFGGMYRDFFSSISKYSDFEAVYISDFKDINSTDIIVIPMGSGQDSEGCKVMNYFHGKVILYTPPATVWFKKNLLKRWSDKILFVYNTDESTYSKKRYKEINIEYITLPFASNPDIFKPLNIENKIYDVMFAGSALSGGGRYKYTDKLIERAKLKNWKILLIGPGWGKYGYPLQLIGHGELLNLVYNSSKICINISNDEQKLGEDKCLDLNNRVFDLAMAGCFQISNAPELIEKYFSKEEICTVDNPDEWIDSIDKYLSDEQFRKEMAEKARIKAIKLHTWNNRSEKIIEKINLTLNKSGHKNRDGFLTKILKRVDYSGLYSLLYKVGIIISIIKSKFYIKKIK
jgi:hypothetical protein